MEIVARRDRATLAAIMNRVILPNTELHTDQWRGYLNIDLHVPAIFRHDTVNHTLHFVDPVTGTHTQVYSISTTGILAVNFTKNMNIF